MANNKLSWSVFQTLYSAYFFHPNVCHVCKKLKYYLIECSMCRMISYCSEEHRRSHQPRHAEICKAIMKLSKQRRVWNNRVMTLEAWTKFKEDNLLAIQEMLPRNLEPYEKQMFLLAKSCIVCHRQDELFDFCTDCLSVNTCYDHDLKAVTHPCSQLQRCLKLNRHNSEKVKRFKASWRSYSLFLHSVVNLSMELAMKMILRERRTSKYTLHDYILTDDFSGSLTLLHALLRTQMLHEMKKRPNFTVHLMSDKLLDVRNMLAWETVLHELRFYATLKIVSVGMEFCNILYSFVTCKTCAGRLKKFEYEGHNMLYQNYVHLTLHKPPDVIVALNVELRHKGWDEIIRAWQRLHCPLLLTAKSRNKAIDNITMIQEVLGSSVFPILNEENKFRSFKPYRDYESDSVFYPNEYLTFYRDLSNSNNPIQSGNSSSGV